MRTLAIAFFVLAGLSLIGPFAAAIAVLGDASGDVLPFIGQSGLGGLLASTAIGLVYLALGKAGAGATTAVIGWIQLVLTAFSTVGLVAGNMILVGDGALDQSRLGLLFGVSSAFHLLATIVFIIALITAINAISRPPEPARTF